MVEVGFNSYKEEQPVGFSPGAPPPSADTSSARAFMFQYGLGPQVGNRPLEELNTAIKQGKENDLRNEAAANIDVNDLELRRRSLRLMSQQGIEFDNEVLKRIGLPIGTNPNTVLEQAYAKKYIDTASSMAKNNMKDTPFAQADNELPKQTSQVKNQVAEHVSKMTLILKRLQDAKDAYDGQTHVGAGIDYLKRWFPGYDEAKLRGWLGSFMYPFLEGNNLDEQSQNLMDKPWGAKGGFEDSFNPIMDKLIRDNPQIAMEFAQAMYGQSASERAINNLTTAFDISSIPGTGLAAKGVRRLLGLLNDTKVVTGDMVRGMKESPTWIGHDVEVPWDIGKPEGSAAWYNITEERAAQAAGDHTEAGVKKFTRQLNTEKRTGDPNNPQNAIESLTSIGRMDVKDWTANPGRVGQEWANRAWERFNTYNDKLINFIKHVGRVETLPELNEEVARAMVPELRQWYRGYSDGIYDVSFAGKNPITNAYEFDLHIIQPDMQPYKTIIQAEGAAKKIGGMVLKPTVKGEPYKVVSPFKTYLKAEGEAKRIGGAIPEGPYRAGMGYKVIKRVTLPEDSKLVSGLRASTEDGRLQGVSGWVAGISRWRTSKEILSIDENTQRRIATGHPEVLLGLAEEASRDISKLPKGLPFTSTRKMWNQWYQAIEHSKTRWKETGGEESWFANGQEMDDFFLRNFDRAATDQEKLAYMAYQRNIENQRIWSTIRLYSNKAKWGAEQHQFHYYDKEGKKVASGFVEARLLPELPKDARATVYIQTGKDAGRVRRVGSGLDEKTMERIQKGELKVAQVALPKYSPLKGFAGIGDQRIKYIITDKFESKPLDWETQIPRQGGGHFVYDYNYFIKQARIRAEMVAGQLQHWYEGDTTLVPISIRASGEQLVKHLNAVREHIKAGNLAEAKAYHDSVQWDLDWETHHGWYQEQKGENYKPARLDVNEPLRLVRKDKTIIDLDKDLENRYPGTFNDDHKDSDLSRMAVDFTGERDAADLMTLRDEGTGHNPIWKYEPAKFADALGVMNRSMNKSIKALFMDDMKNLSMRNWLTQMSRYLNVDINTLMHSPEWHFKNADTFLKPGSKDNPEVKQLQAAKFIIQQFQGVPNKLDTTLHTMQQGMADMLYGKGGAKIVPQWLLANVHDPAAYFRSMVVHMKLGLFNPTAFFVQASTHLNIYGIAGPTHAAPGTFGMFMHQWARINPGVAMDTLDKWASRFGYRPGEFKEAYDELALRGFEKIGHSHAFEDAPYQAKPIRGRFGQLLDWGQFPFREGAESVRRAAWYTAYHEYRNGAAWTKGAHPTGKLTEREWNRIESRADDLDHNMSRAANSQIQSGFMSFPLQFQSYHLRLMELATGKRLTWAEKGRLFLTTSIAYGIPLGGMGLLPIPYLNEYISDSAKKNGIYVPGEKFVNDVIMRGLPDAMMKQITGTNQNISERWGTGKFDMLDVYGDESFWQVLTGAAGSTFINTVKNSMPIIRAGLAFIQGDYSDYPVTANDFLTLLTSELSSGSDFTGFVKTLNTGKFFSKTGTYLSDVDGAAWKAALLRYGVGLTPQPVFDLNKIREWGKQDEAMYKSAERDIIKDIHAELESNANNDPEQAKKYHTRAMTRGTQAGIPPNLLINYWVSALKSSSRPLVDNAEQNFWIGPNVPVNQRQQRQDTYERILRSRGQQQ